MLVAAGQDPTGPEAESVNRLTAELVGDALQRGRGVCIVDVGVGGFVGVHVCGYGSGDVEQCSGDVCHSCTIDMQHASCIYCLVLCGIINHVLSSSPPPPKHPPQTKLVMRIALLSPPLIKQFMLTPAEYTNVSPSIHNAELWPVVLKAMNLTRQQRQDMIQLRRLFLHKLLKVVQARAEINQKLAV